MFVCDHKVFIYIYIYIYKIDINIIADCFFSAQCISDINLHQK